MTKALVLAAAFGLSMAGANACEFHNTAHNTAKVDMTSVASVTKTETQPAQTMSTPTIVIDDQVAENTVITEEAK